MASNLIEACDLQVRLNDTFLTDGSMQNYAPNTPLATWLFNEANSQKFQQKLLDRNGQSTTVKVVWDVPYTSADVNDVDGVPDDCTGGGDPKGQTSATYEIQNTDTYNSIQTVFTLEDYRVMAGLDGEMGDVTTQLNPNRTGNAWEREIYKMIQALEEKKEADLATELVAGIPTGTGGFSSKENLTLTSNAKVVKTFGNVTSGQTVIDDAYYETGFSARTAGFSSLPTMIGGKPLEQYMQRLGHGCCATGFDVQKWFENNKLPMLFSWDIVTALQSANRYISVDMGAAQIVSAQRHKGKFELNTQLHRKQTIISPVTTRAIDYSVKINTCDGGSVIVTVGCNEKIFFRPATLFPSTDHRYKVNGIQKFVISN